MAVNSNHVAPPWADVLRRRREELSEREGVRVTQEEVSARTNDLVAQRTVSHLEKGTVDLASLAITRVAALARALRWTLYELQQATGVDLGIEEPTAKGFQAFPLETRRVRHGGIVGAGWNLHSMSTGSHAERWIPDAPYLRKFDDDTLFTLEVRGESMTCVDVRFSVPEGTTVIMAKIDPQPGDIIAVYLPALEMGILKVFRPQEDSVILESYNREHLPIRMDEHTEFEIQGVMVGMVSVGRRAHLRR